jgi:hypothetical protein
MSTKLLPGDDKLVADLQPHDRDDLFLAFRIIQDPNVTRSQFVLGHRIGTQPLDGPSDRRRLVLERRCDAARRSRWSRAERFRELPIRVLSNRDARCHSLRLATFLRPYPVTSL